MLVLKRDDSPAEERAPLTWKATEEQDGSITLSAVCTCGTIVSLNGFHVDMLGHVHPPVRCPRCRNAADIVLDTYGLHTELPQ